MKYIISGTDFKQVDKYTIDNIGIPSMVLMERAALAVADEIISTIESDKRVGVFCGTGNNGADGIAVARMLSLRGYDTCIFIVGNIEKATLEFNRQQEIYKKLGGTIIQYKEGENIAFLDCIVDAIFGIGLSREIGGLYAEAIDNINRSDAYRIAVDVPSGIDTNRGEVLGCAIRCKKTVTFGTYKTGMLLYPATEYIGELIVADIGIPNVSYKKAKKIYALESKDLKSVLRRNPDSNKGNYGKILIIAGNESMSGAAILSSVAAFRMGAGLVKVLTPYCNVDIIKKFAPEIMVDGYDSSDVREKLKNSLQWCSVVAVGPGMGVGNMQKDIVSMVLDSKRLTVIDADGINCIGGDSFLESKLHNKVVLTPHVGEMSRLTKKSIEEIKKDRIDIAKEYSYEHSVCVVLKDSRTVVTNKDAVYINLSGNDGMATAGSGDVLTGIVAAIIAKNADIEELDMHTKSVAGAVFIHGLAGDAAADKKSKTSLMAMDIVSELVGITKQFE